MTIKPVKYGQVMGTKRITVQAAECQSSHEGYPQKGVTIIPRRLFFCTSRLAKLRYLIPRATLWAGTFREADLEAVRIVSRTATTPRGRTCAVGISKLGNGWIYPLLATLILIDLGSSGYRIILLSSVNAAAVHCLYPFIKWRFRRERPFEVDRGLPSLLPTLDEHSFPSGHVMTLTGVLVPMVILWPATAIAAVLMACSLAWARVATAHHFPSDVIVGALLGISIGYAISATFIPLW